MGVDMVERMSMEMDGDVTVPKKGEMGNRVSQDGFEAAWDKPTAAPANVESHAEPVAVTDAATGGATAWVGSIM
jgi:hypothetical protein